MAISSQRSQCPEPSRVPVEGQRHLSSSILPAGHLWNKILSSNTQGEPCFKYHVSFWWLLTGTGAANLSYHYQRVWSELSEPEGLSPRDIYIFRIPEGSLDWSSSQGLRRRISPTTLPFLTPNDVGCSLGCGCIASNAVVFTWPLLPLALFPVSSRTSALSLDLPPTRVTQDDFLILRALV